MTNCNCTIVACNDKYSRVEIYKNHKGKGNFCLLAWILPTKRILHYTCHAAKRQHALRPTLTRISSSISGAGRSIVDRPVLWIVQSFPCNSSSNASRNVTRGSFLFFYSHSTSFPSLPVHSLPPSISQLRSLQNWGWVEEGRKTAETRPPLFYPSSSYFKSDGLAFCMQRTLARWWASTRDRGMWVISIAAEIGPITPATIERCNYSAANDEKKKEEEGWRNKKWFKEKRGEREKERKKKKIFIDKFWSVSEKKKSYFKQRNLSLSLLLSLSLSLSCFWSLEEPKRTWRIVGNIKLPSTTRSPWYV